MIIMALASSTIRRTVSILYKTIWICICGSKKETAKYGLIIVLVSYFYPNPFHELHGHL